MPNGQWNVDAGGNWSDTTRWLNGTVPDGVDSTALLVNQITNTRTTTVNGNYTVGSVSFADNNGNGSDRVLSASAGVSLTLAVTSGTPVIVNNTSTTVNTGALSGSQGFRLRTDLPTSIGFFNFRILGTQPIAGVAYIGNSTNDGYISLGAFQSGAVGQFPNITEYVFAGMTMQIYGNGASTIPQILSGNGQIYSENPGIQTFTGSAASFTGLLGGYTSNTVLGTARQFYFSNALPLSHSLWIASTPGTISTVQTLNYTGSVNVSSTAGARQFDFRSAGSATITMLYANSTSVSDTLLTLGGNHINVGGGASNVRVVRFDCSSGPITYTGSWAMGATPGTNRLEKNGAHLLILSDSLQHNNTTNINSGPVSVQHDDALGNSSTSTVTLGSGTTLNLLGTRNLNKGVTALSLVSSTINTEADTGANSYTCGGVTLSAGNTTINVASGSSFSFINSGAIIGSGIGLVKNGDGELILPTASNTFTGNITVNGGDLTVGSISSAGSPSSWGAGSGTINIPGALKINGTGGSTTRTINLAGTTTTIDSSGSNPVSFSSVTQSSGYRVIALDGTNAGNNTISAPIGNGSVGSSTQIAKNGSGKWKLTGALTYTGITEVNEGTLNIGSTSQTFANDVILSAGTRLEADSGGSCSGAVYCTGAQIYTPLNTFSVTLNGTSEIGSLLSGNGSLYVNAGTTTIESESTNTYSGTSTVSSGSTVVARALQNPSSLSTGKVFGDSNLSMGGTLYTASTGNQQGKLRYGGSVTFGTGAQIHIGGA